MLRDAKNFFRQKDLDFFKILKNVCKKCSFNPDNKVYLYGGFIRDIIINKKSKDMDLMISENICEEFIEILKEELVKIYNDEFLYVDERHHYLDEYPKKDYNLYSLRIEILNLNLGVVELKNNLNKELENNEFSFNSLCYDI